MIFHRPPSNYLGIRGRTRSSSLELIKEYIRARGLNPEQILTREAFLDNATTVVDPEDYQLKKLR